MFDLFFRLVDDFGNKRATAQYALISFFPFTRSSHCPYNRPAAHGAYQTATGQIRAVAHGNPLFNKCPVQSPRFSFLVAKPFQNIFPVLPIVLPVIHHHGMSTPFVPIQFHQLVHDPRSQGIQMNITNQFPEIRIFIADN